MNEKSQNRIYEAALGVKRNLSRLRPGCHTRWVAGGNVRDLKFGWHDLSQHLFKIV